MRYLLLAVVLFIIPQNSYALPFQDGIVTVGKRDFVVGEITDSYGEDAWSFNLRHAPWLETLLNDNPVLSDYGVRFFRSGVPAIELVERAENAFLTRMVIETDPLYMAENHDVFNVGNLDQYIYPKDSSLIYEVSCTRGGFSPGELNICDLMVVYPYGTNVTLTARKYFPGILPEVSRNFESMAARMIEIAICLDVTDLPDADRLAHLTKLKAENPKLSNCETPLGS